MALAIEDRQDREEARSCELRRRAEQEHAHELTAKRLKAESAVAGEEVLRKKKQIKELESVLEARHKMKTFTPEQLGYGAKAKNEQSRGRRCDSKYSIGSRILVLA